MSGKDILSISKIMATSAQNLQAIINLLAKKYKFDAGDALVLLAQQELLPKKLIPKVQVLDTPWASKKAEEVASMHGIVAEGPGSGKNGKWTLADVEKAMSKPVQKKLLVSPNALNLANDKGLSLVGKKGSGKDGRILLRDVESWLDDDEVEDDLNISQRALQEANAAKISQKELATLHGSGRDGRILLEDIKKYISESDKSDDEDEED